LELKDFTLNSLAKYALRGLDSIPPTKEFAYTQLMGPDFTKNFVICMR